MSFGAVTAPALLAASSNGKELWYLTRGSGAVALLLLTASVLLGVANTTRWKTSRWPRFLVYGLHRNVTLLALVFTVLHVVTTVADSFAPIGLLDAFVPFLSSYRPLWLGLGTVAFDLMLALIVTSFLRRRIGTRAWRAVHWLAYASWPVALLHSFGTGSDARSGWLAVLGVLCAATVLAAIVWRLLAIRDAAPGIRAGATIATVTVLVLLFVWAQSGPRARGWAARAGTPSNLLASARRPVSTVKRRPASHPAPAQPAATLPRGPFTSTLSGRLTETQSGDGLVVVAVDGVASGAFHGRIHLALRGEPIDEGGVQMIDSVVGLLPSGAPAWYRGTVVNLEGTRVVAEIHRDSGAPVRVLFDLSIDGSDNVTGSLRAA